MDLKTYQQEAIKTVNRDLDTFDITVMCTVGIIGELGELFDVYKKQIFHGKATPFTEWQKELGDLVWYVVVLHYIAGGWGLNQFDSLREQFASYSGNTLDRLSEIKGYADNVTTNILGYYNAEALDKMLLDPANRKLIGFKIMLLLAAISAHAKFLANVDLETIMQINVDKLRARHGESWSDGHYDSTQE